MGCGQLARMMALAGKNMGIRFSLVALGDESPECVEGLGAIVSWQQEDLDAQALYDAMGRPDVVTVERENISVELLRALQSCCPVHPNPDAVSHCQNRLRERRLLRSLAIETAPFAEAYTVAQVAEAIEKLGLPVVVKHASAGYDGRNQWRIRSEDDLAAFSEEQGDDEWLVEQWIRFDNEVSLIAVRSASGEVAVYPPTLNTHQDGILIRSLVPAPGLSGEQASVADRYIRKLLDAMDYVGVLTMECFVVGDRVLVNELAPRVHNSGHWTQQGDVTSQFENHLRAILGLPLGSTSLRGYAGIVNILGKPPGAACFAALAGNASLHWYDKQPRPGRKLGHVAVSGAELESVVAHLDRVHGALYEASGDDTSRADDSD
jgi:5-(carboxyamino)imidazole ribonucleotide synthase